MSVAEASHNQQYSLLEEHRFKYLISIEPLGLLYGSAGRFLSPENLVGRSGSSFPPHSTTLSGLYAANYDDAEIRNLMLAGAFWGYTEEVTAEKQNFYVPTPHNYLVLNAKIEHKLFPVKNTKYDLYQWLDENNESPVDKFESNSWLAINQWENPQEVKTSPWKYLPHLHPRLELNQRHVATEDLEERGSLFLENSVQMEPGSCLIYLSNKEIESGWYRFGGEGHMVDLRCELISEHILELLNKPVSDKFALITPGVWGSNRLSYQHPICLESGNQDNKGEVWNIETLLTKRPIPFRYRLGNSENHQPHQPKLLSRGRYAIPAGSVYILSEPINQPWQDWDEKWFPKEGPSLKRWGCGLALPI